MRHVAALAGDAFEGRAPGSIGEARTIAYVVGQWAKAGLEPLEDSATPWLQPVPLRESQTRESHAAFHVLNSGSGTDSGANQAASDLIPIRADQIRLTSQKPHVSLKAAPVVFVGYGVNGDGEIVADVSGKVAVMLIDDAPFARDLPRYRERRRMLSKAGAAAVLVIASKTIPWKALRDSAMGAMTVLADTVPEQDTAPEQNTASEQDNSAPDIAGFLSPRAANRLLAEQVGQTRQTTSQSRSSQAQALRDAAQSANFAGVELGIRADLTVKSHIRAYDSHNIIAKLPGAKPDGKAVLFLGHWDHLGFCRPKEAPDRICNGAVDNASGISVLIEVAKALGSEPRADRDIYFMATTAEEKGLLGAYYFAEHPVMPLDSIVVALNIDTIAISPRATPVATIGRGRVRYDRFIAEVATRLGRAIDTDGEADAFIRRQDGWALGAKNVPALMVGGSFSNMALLQTFLRSVYHGPGDQPSAPIELGGAAEDADLHIALGRAFASREQWPADQRK